MHSLTRTTWAALVWFVPLLLVLGCASSKDMSYARNAGPGAYGGAPMPEEAEYGARWDDGGGDASEYDYADDMAEGEFMTEGANISSGSRAKRSELREEAPTPAKPEPADVETVEQPAPPPDDAPAPTPSPKRQIIYTATMQVSVYDVEDSIAVAESLPDRFGGWLHQRVDDQLILRIPAEHLDEAMAIIAELGVVDYRLLESLDVTAQYTDLESRIRVLRETKAQLERLLNKAKTVEQALEIRKALDQVTMELELAEAHMRELAKSIAFSTLVVRIVARGPEHALPSSNDPFPWVLELGVEATEYR